MKKLLFLFYGIFLLVFVAFSYVFVDPGLFYLRPLFTNFFQLHRVMTTSLFICFVFLFFGFYSLFLYFVKKDKLSKRNIFQLIIVSVVVLLLAYPAMVSFDIFNYIATAKVTFFYHENPYILMPIEFTRDPLLLFMHAANKTALYAPIWILLSGIPYIFGFGNFLLTLFNFKVFIALFYLLTVALIWKITRNKMQTAFFALNPLVLIETLISSHNDIVMMFFLLVSINFLFFEKWGKGIVYFLLSSGIKYVSVVLTPLYILHYFKHFSKDTFFLWTTFLLYCVFFLSSFREEIYPWYAIWFLLPLTFIAKNNLLTWVSTAFSFSMLLRYIPFMLLGTYFGPTPLLKILLMLIPVLVTIITYFVTQKEKHFV